MSIFHGIGIICSHAKVFAALKELLGIEGGRQIKMGQGVKFIKRGRLADKVSITHTAARARQS